MKIGIIGSGFVGSTAAYAILMNKSASEIVLVDANKPRALAEAADILHAVPFVHPVTVRAGEMEDLTGAKVLIVTAGAAQQPGESRLDLLKRNAVIIRTMVRHGLTYTKAFGKMAYMTKDASVIVATNPVDIMTHLAAVQAAEMGVATSRIFGSGTILDTARFRSLLSTRLKVDPQHIHGYVIGEHGDSEVLAWSGVSVAGLGLDEFCAARSSALPTETRAVIDRDVRQAAYQIIAGKKATYYGIGAALAHLVAVIAGDRHAIMTVCTPIEEVLGVKNVSLSLPHLVGSDGLIQRLPISLSSEEERKLEESARVIRAACDDMCGCASS